jgi:hypothetical protein
LRAQSIFNDLTATEADHRKLAVNHLLRFAERCEYLGVIGNAEQPIATRRWTVNAAEKLPQGIIANYSSQLQSSTIDCLHMLRPYYKAWALRLPIPEVRSGPSLSLDSRDAHHCELTPDHIMFLPPWCQYSTVALAQSAKSTGISRGGIQ